MLTGGLYYGGYPSDIEHEDKNCKTEIIEAYLLNEKVDWQVFDCNNAYSVQTIIDLDDWAKFHAFGNAQSEKDVQTLIDIYSTLRGKLNSLYIAQQTGYWHILVNSGITTIYKLNK